MTYDNNSKIIVLRKTDEFHEYPALQKQYVQKTILGEPIFGSLHEFHVINSASKITLGKPEFCVQFMGLATTLNKIWGGNKFGFIT